MEDAQDLNLISRNSIANDIRVFGENHLARSRKSTNASSAGEHFEMLDRTTNSGADFWGGGGISEFDELDVIIHVSQCGARPNDLHVRPRRIRDDA